jgi:hypothetical protein
VRCFTFPVAPLTVKREIGKKRRHGREAPPLSLLLQRKERIARAPGLMNWWQYKKYAGQKGGNCTYKHIPFLAALHISDTKLGIPK